jgi:hypothetical protein
MPQTVELTPPEITVPAKLPPWKAMDPKHPELGGQAPKQMELMRLCRYKTGHRKAIGVFGTRLSGKTTAALGCIADHMWRTKNAAVLILVGTMGGGSTSGVWNLLTETVLPSWFEHDICNDEKNQPMRMKWAPKGEPRATIAKKLVCATTNMHGGISKLELDSLNHEEDVELNYKSRYYTMVYWSEAGEFTQDSSFTTLFLDLRGAGYAPDDFVMLVDANPPDSGEDHFLFKRFFVDRVASDLDIEQQAIANCLHVTNWTMEDNPFLTEDEKNATKGLYRSDPDRYDRYIRGMWKRALKDALFADCFIKAIHVYGDPRDETPMLLLPSENCYELITSHDAGGMNPVSYIVEEIVFNQTYEDRSGKQRTRQVSFFQYLDELAYIGKRISVADFTRLKMEKLDFWEKEIGAPVTWWHYSDMSALDFTESIADRTVADEMFAESEGRIKLIGVEKGAGSVGLRIRLWRKLLTENRVVISGLKCPMLVEMSQSIRRGPADGTVAKGDRFKHPFDAGTYCLVKRCYAEIQAMIRQNRINSRPKTEGDSSGLVQIRL